DEFKEQATLAASADQGDPLAPILATDVIIDFSSPAGVVALVAAAQASGSSDPGELPALVIGSTGWKIDDRSQWEKPAASVPIMMSSNFPTGVLALLEILRQASPLLEKLGYLPVIVETHHRHKKDSPSGTALSIQRTVSPAGPGNVQTHSVRAG